MPVMYAVYIVTNKPRGTLYIGKTSDLTRRIYEHKQKAVDGFTEKYNCSNLVYYEMHEDVRLANQREATLKHWLRDWKIALIEKDNPGWKDLYEDVVHA